MGASVIDAIAHDRLPPGVKAWPEDARQGQYSGCFLTPEELATVAAVQGQINAITRHAYHRDNDVNDSGTHIEHNDVADSFASVAPDPNTEDGVLTLPDASESD